MATKRLTKRKALEQCIVLWDWLAENPENHKEDCPMWKKVGEYHNLCPCCEYGKRNSSVFDSICVKCPMLGYWTPEANSLCCQNGSPYHNWDIEMTGKNKNLKLLSTYATTIADGARAALAKLNEVKK